MSRGARRLWRRRLQRLLSLPRKHQSFLRTINSTPNPPTITLRSYPAADSNEVGEQRRFGDAEMVKLFQKTTTGGCRNNEFEVEWYGLPGIGADRKSGPLRGDPLQNVRRQENTGILRPGVAWRIRILSRHRIQREN